MNINTTEFMKDIGNRSKLWDILSGLTKRSIPANNTDDIDKLQECDDIIYDEDDTVNMEKCRDVLSAVEGKLVDVNMNISNTLSLHQIFSKIDINDCNDSKCKNRDNCWLQYSVTTELKQDIGKDLSEMEHIRLRELFCSTMCYLKMLGELKEFRRATVELVKLLVEAEDRNMNELHKQFSF